MKWLWAERMTWSMMMAGTGRLAGFATVAICCGLARDARDLLRGSAATGTARNERRLTSKKDPLAGVKA